MHETIGSGSGVPGEMAGCLRRGVVCFAVVASLVFLASLLGTFSRPYGHLAAFWPANAVLLGVFVRFRVVSGPWGWCGAILGYLAAGYMAGDPWRENLLLTLGNFAGVVTGYLLYRRLGSADRGLSGASSVLKMLLVVAAASASAAAVGTVIDPILFGGGVVGGGVMWFIVEAVNYIAILPAVLTVPRGRPTVYWRRWRDGVRAILLWSAPIACLILAFMLGVFVGGPGAVVFPIVALLWCALSLGLFVTSLLTLAYTAWTLLAISCGLLYVSDDIASIETMTSIRLGVTLIAVCPLVVASATAARKVLVGELRYLAEHDPLTGVVNRRAFHDQSTSALVSLQAQGRPSGLLILDIDHFKHVNDSFGHAIGDRVIQRVTQCVREALEPGGSVFGRLGGEEFGVFLPSCDEEKVAQLASGIVVSCAQAEVQLEDGRLVGVTVSIGGAWSCDSRMSLDALLQAADATLYRAKKGGRNRFEMDLSSA